MGREESPFPSTDTESISASINSKTKKMKSIRAAVNGLLRIFPIDRTGEINQNKLCIGVIEECLHPTFFEGLCVVCGTPRASLKEEENNLLTKNIVNSNSQVTVSGGITMTISEAESRRMALFDTERLFGQKRLSLVLDLDHTLVHATSDARARQYLATSNSQTTPCEDVRTITLPMFEGADRTRDQNWSHHFVKLRPHVQEFLQGVQTMYELTVYTAGTRQYAEEIAMLLCRKVAGSRMDYDDLQRFRYQVKMAEVEYAKYDGIKNDKKRTIDQTLTEEENKNNENAVTEPSKKRKKVSFGFSKDVDDDDEGCGTKSDHMTKNKLDKMRSELLLAESLEIKTRELRQQIFGSRIVSRTDVGDLGRDVKSLKRIFPCGGKMVAVVDDREDVWANAKDNSEKTIKGEPPDNLLLVKPYHWSPFVGFADINNAAGKDLSGSEQGDRVDPNNENDVQLLWTKRILEDLHKRYYSQSSEMNRVTVPDLLKKMRQEVLSGSKIVLSGLVPLYKQSDTTRSFLMARPPFVRYAQNLGAKTQDIVNYSVTHVVAAKDGTDKAMAARGTPGCMLVTPAWLMECYWSITPRDVKSFLIHKGTKQNLPLQNSALREVNIENSSEGSSNNSDDDDDFAADFEDELMNS